MGDLPIDSYDWVNGFSWRQTGKKVKVFPRELVYLLAKVGNGLARFHVGFPMTTSRFRNMTSDNVTPMEKTVEAFGVPPYTLDQGIAETVAWMKVNRPDLVGGSE